MGRCVLTFMSTCCARTCYITPGFGVSGGVLSFMSTCCARACYITPGFGVPEGGVIVHVNLPHTHMRRHAMVNAMWRSKSAIPCSLATRVNSQVNPKLMRSIRVWQWRWMNSKAKNLLEITCSLQKRMAM